MSNSEKILGWVSLFTCMCLAAMVIFLIVYFG